jgi:hypothetical protein
VTPQLRSIAVTLALGAMLLRAILPAGWMPNVSGAPLVICSIDGVHHGAPAQDPLKGSQQDEHACPFAMAAHLAPPQFPAVVLAPFSVAQFGARIEHEPVTPDPHDPGHTPRGPPVFV